jgi:hypothetical protein
MLPLVERIPEESGFLHRAALAMAAWTNDGSSKRDVIGFAGVLRERWLWWGGYDLRLGLRLDRKLADDLEPAVGVLAHEV